MNFILFLGAGASAEFEIPLFKEIAKSFLREDSYAKHKERVERISKELVQSGFESNIENYISYAKGQLRPKETLSRMNPFVSYFVCRSARKRLGYDPSSEIFVNDLEEYIYDRFFVHEYEKKMKILTHYDSFFKFLNDKYCEGRDLGKFEVDIFTTNYDNVIEEYSEERGFDIFDGYAEKPDKMSYFAPELYVTHKIKLYKLHGSVRLGIVEDTNTRAQGIIHTKARIQIGGLYKGNWRITERIMLLGYDKDVSKEPYFELLNLLKKKLMATKTCMVIGYSFSDGPILNIFRDVLNHREDDFELVLLSESAHEVKRNKFSDDDRVRALECRFSDFQRI